MEEIDLKELLIFVKDKIGLLITITAGVCILGCIYGLFIQTPMYESYTTVILSSNESSSAINQADVNLNRVLVDTYAEIVRSRRVLTQVIDELDLDLSYEDLYNKITVSAVNDTEIIKIAVNDKDGIKAKEYFTEEIVVLYNMNNVDILDEAIESEKPYNINVVKQTIIYLMLGFIIAAGILFIIFYFDRSVKSIEQVEQKIKLPILGGVQDISKNKGGRK